MLTIILVIFFLQIGFLIWYLLNYPHTKYFEKTIVKFCYLSSICMMGSFLIILIVSISNEIDLDRIHKHRDFPSLFLFSYFGVAIILLLKNIGRRLK